MMKPPPRVQYDGKRTSIKAFTGRAILAPAPDSQSWVLLLAKDDEGLRVCWEQLVPDRPWHGDAEMYTFDAALAHRDDFKLTDDI